MAQLQVADDDGLSDNAVTARLRYFGPNTVASRRSTSVLRLIWHQFKSPVVYLLSAAAALALLFGEFEESGAIVVVLLLNATIGLVTEFRAARSIEALRALGSHMARVRRAGQVRLIPAAGIVPGDIVLLEAGDAVTADLRLIEASALAADESTLTGESVAVAKDVKPVPRAARPPERTSMLFKGTTVTRGSAVGVVVATGLSTELGRITQLVLNTQPGSSPLEKKLSKLSTQLAWATLVIASVIGIIGTFTHQNFFLVAETAIALAVAAIPEGLPIVATLALARGMWRMAQQNALVEHLSAVETLGATTLILTDKTGTLTENRMTVKFLAGPTATADLGLATNHLHNPVQPAENRQIQDLLRTAVLCNDAHLSSVADKGSGDPMEIALLRAGLIAGLTQTDLLRETPIIHKYAFDPNLKMMATVHATPSGTFVAVKGAPEAVIAATQRVATAHGVVKLDDSARAEWLGRASALGERGLRVLACATRTSGNVNDPPYDDLVLIGLIGLEDPARADVGEAILRCQHAGVRVVMVTGDHAVTARNIAQTVGIDSADAPVVEGKHVDALVRTGITDLRKVRVFARVSPAEKFALVKAYQAAGDIVAMTGDGVNDAPALRQADIGVAMGMRGTDAARQAADMILLDDSFSTIVKAIRQGRIIFGNIRRVVVYLLSCNISEIMVVGIAAMSTLPLPLMPLQLLYLNLVTDVFPAFALAMGEGDTAILERPPHAPHQPILGRSQWRTILLTSLALTMGTFAALISARWQSFSADQAVTVTFMTLAFAQLWHVFNMHSLNANILRNEITRNGWLWAALALCVFLLIIPLYVRPAAQILDLSGLTAPMWVIVLACSIAPLVLVQMMYALIKYLRSR